MTHVLKSIAAILTAATVLLAAGCSGPQTSAQAKAIAKERWLGERAGILYNVALQQFEAGALDKSEASCNEAMSQVKDERPEFYELLGRIALERGQLERAYKTLELGDKLDSKRYLTHYLMGVIMERWQRYDIALEQYELSYTYRADDVAGLLAVTEMLVKLNRNADAITRLESKMNYFDHSASLRVALGRVYLLDRKLDLAVARFREASLLVPDDAMVREQLVLAQFAAGLHGEAIEGLTLLLATPEGATRDDLRMTLSDCYIATQRPIEARSTLIEVTRHKPADVNAWVKLAQAAWIVGDTIRVRESASRIIALAPQRHEGHLLRGMLEQKAGNSAKALAEFDRAVELAPNNTLPLIMRGMALQQAGKARDAAATYQAALKIDPSDDRAKRLLASVTP